MLMLPTAARPHKAVGRRTVLVVTPIAIVVGCMMLLLLSLCGLLVAALWRMNHAEVEIATSLDYAVYASSMLRSFSEQSVPLPGQSANWSAWVDAKGPALLETLRNASAWIESWTKLAPPKPLEVYLG